MGAGIIRGQKIKADGLRGMQIHVMRSRESKSNPDIDAERSAKNYSLDGLTAYQLNRRVAERIAELPGQRTKTGKIRKVQSNAVRMYDFVVTAGHEDMERLGDAGARAYFKDTLDFMRRRYGARNVMYAPVHIDESTPHIHIGLVPEYQGKLGANLLFTPESMRSLQDDFFEEVSSKYGLERGEVGSKRKHESAVELKSRTMREVNELKEEYGAVRQKARLLFGMLDRVRTAKDVRGFQKAVGDVMRELRVVMSDANREKEGGR